MTEVQHSADCGKTFGGILIICPRCNQEMAAEIEALSRYQHLLLDNPMAGVLPLIWKGVQ